MDQVNLTGGATAANNSCVGWLPAIERLGFPGLCLNDAGEGIRGTDFVSSWGASNSIAARYVLACYYLFDIYALNYSLKCAHSAGINSLRITVALVRGANASGKVSMSSLALLSHLKAVLCWTADSLKVSFLHVHSQ